MLIRKHFEDAKLLSVTQLGFDRIKLPVWGRIENPKKGFKVGLIGADVYARSSKDWVGTA